MSVMAETSHVPMAHGVHVPIDEVVMQSFTAVTRFAFVVYTGTEDVIAIAQKSTYRRTRKTSMTTPIMYNVLYT